MFSSYCQSNKKLTLIDRKDRISHTFSNVNADIYFNGLTIPLSDFTYHMDKQIFVPIDAYKIVEWRNEYPPTEQFMEMVNATIEDDNPVFLIFDFKQ